MLTKGMRSIFAFSSKTSSSSCPSPLRSAPSSPLRTLSESMMEENLEIASSIITKWDPNGSTYAKVTSLFHESRREAFEFIKCVRNLQKAMHFFVSENSSSEKVIRAQNLMQTAMKRLQKEFYQILSANRDHLDPESVSVRSSVTSARSSVSSYEDDAGSEDEIQEAGESISEVEQVSSQAMSDLKYIADCMISSGYGKECVKIYKIIRKSIVDEGIYRLGVERWSSSKIQKMDWEVLELKIKYWLNAVKVAVKTLFYGERILCDHVFSSSPSISESVFSEISREGALILFSFPESVSKTKKSPEKMFRILDLYEAISGLWQEIESIFALESTITVRSQALTSLLRLGEAVRTTLSDFESAIQKDSSKSPIPGGGLHPLTRYVMNYIVFLGDYSGILSDIIADWPLPVQAPLPDSYLPSLSAEDDMTSPISVRIAWIVLALLCKLDGKAEPYKDVSLSYLFLANNLQYVIEKVRSSNLRSLLGDDWISRHELKLKQYAANYERMGWGKVYATLPEDPKATISVEEAKECFRRFNSEFEQAYRKQSSWVVSDEKLRDEIKMSITRKLVPAYRVFYDKYRVTLRRERNFDVLIKFAPDDLDNDLSDLLYGTTVSGSTSSSSSPRQRGRRSH